MHLESAYALRVKDVQDAGMELEQASRVSRNDDT